jgi:hypothetical protein
MPSSSAAPLPSVSSAPSPAAGVDGTGAGTETITTYDQQGFLTTAVVPQGWATMAKSFNQEGFLVTPVAAAATAAPPVGLKNMVANDAPCQRSARMTNLLVGIAAMLCIAML